MADKEKKIFDIILERARKNPESTAISGIDSVELTYFKLLEHVNYIRDKLRNASIGNKDRVAVILSRGLVDVVMNLGVAGSFVAVPLNPEHSLKEFEYYFKEFKIKAIAVDDSINKGVVNLAKRLGIVIINMKKPCKNSGLVFNLDILGGKKYRNSKMNYSGVNDTAFILHTSGTTAKPKIVPITHKNVYFGARNIIKALKLSKNDCCLNLMPLFHVHGLMVTIACLYAGGCVISSPKFERYDFFKWLDKCQPTWYTASAALQQAILSVAGDYKYVIKKQKLRLIRSSSAPLPKESTARLEKIFSAPVAESYGMTETTLQITSQPLPPAKRKFGSVGKPAGPELAIINKRGGALPRGKTGEIILRGKNIIKAYENNPKANKESFLSKAGKRFIAFDKNDHSGSWLKTGDLGYIDKDGFVFINGRIKEMINKGGENISPREIDEALLRCAVVEQALTFSMPHRELGEDIAAAVICKKGIKFSENKIREFLKAEIASFKIPARIIRVDELSKTGAGKLKRVGAYEELKKYFKKSMKKPKKDIEKKIIKIWADVLSLNEDEIGIEDNFFELGGDSLKVVEVVKKMEENGMKIGVKDLMDKPTIWGFVRMKA